MSYDPEVVDRVRRVLTDRAGVAEKKMIGGGLSFLVNGTMCCGVRGAALIVRVGRDGRQQALQEPHARPMLLGGRTLSGFVSVEPAGFAAEEALSRWVQRGLDFAARQPAKPGG